VCIADDIVLAKNGTMITAPWIFMKTDRMLAYYESESDVQVDACRWDQAEDER